MILADSVNIINAIFLKAHGPYTMYMMQWFDCIPYLYAYFFWVRICICFLNLHKIFLKIKLIQGMVD